jgi:hypothetical protein
VDNFTFFRSLILAAVGPAAAQEPGALNRDIAERALALARAVYQRELREDFSALVDPARRSECMPADLDD